MRKIKYIVVHCSATRENGDFSAKDIDRWHKERGFKKIGYHYVVKLDGTIEKGRDENVIGAHVKGHNSDSIGICYIGGLDSRGKAKDTRTAAQKAALLELLKKLKKKYPNAKILGHRDFSEDKNHNGRIDSWERMKDCPSFDAKEEYEKL